MLFYLDTSLLDSLRDDTQKEITVIAIHRLLEAWVNGYHLLTAEPEFVEQIIEGGYFKGQDNVYLGKLSYRIVQKFDAFQAFKFFIKVVKPEAETGLFNANGKSYIQLGVNDIAVTRVSLPAKLLVEDENDGIVYCRIGDAYRHSIHSEYLIVNDIVNGGGLTLKTYKRYQHEDEILCLCVVDSDKSFPMDEIGGTAKNVVKIYRENITKNIGYLCSYIIIDALEIENIIPTIFLKEISNHDQQRGKIVDFIIELERKNYSSRLYIDIKNGFSNKNILDGNLRKNTYWGKILKFKKSRCEYLISGDCTNHHYCIFFMPGMGDHALSQIITIITNMSPQKLYEACRSNKAIRAEWDKAGEMMFYWFCADRARYAS